MRNAVAAVSVAGTVPRTHCATLTEVFDVLTVSTGTATPKALAVTDSWNLARQALNEVQSEPADLSRNMEGRFTSPSSILGVHGQRMRWHCNAVSAAAQRIHVPREVFSELHGFHEEFATRVVKGIDRQRTKKKRAGGGGGGDATIDSARIEKVVHHFDEWLEAAFPAHLHPTISVAHLESLLVSHNNFAQGFEFDAPLALKIRPRHGVPFPSIEERVLQQQLGKWWNEQGRKTVVEHTPLDIVSVLNVGCKSGILAAMAMLAGAQKIVACDHADGALETTEQTLQALWRTKRVSTVDRDVQVAKAELFPFSSATSRNEKNEKAFNFTTFEAITPPLFMSPVPMAAFSSSWNRASHDLDRFCEEVSRAGSPVGKLMTDTSYVGIIHNNFDDLLSASDNLRSNFSSSNPVRRLLETSERSTSPFRPRFKLAKNSTVSLQRLGDSILRNEALLQCVEDADERQALEREVTRFYGQLQQELLILERRAPLLVNVAKPGGQKGINTAAEGSQGSSMSIPWRDTFEYNNYLPKRGPPNPFHDSQAVENFSYLNDDDDDLDDQDMSEEERFKHRVLRAETRGMSSNTVADFVNPATGRTYNSEAAQQFSSLFKDEISIAKQAKSDAARTRKIRKMAHKTRATKEWYLDKKSMNSAETQMNLGLELERFDWKIPK